MHNPYNRHPKPYIIAHRGGGGNAPENTNCAFQALAEIDGIHAIETDIHRTRDGVIVATHDPTMDRVSNITGEIANLRWSEVKAADAGYHWTYNDGITYPARGQGCRLLSLDELFALYGHRYILNIDLKPNDLTLISPFLELVRQHDVMKNLVVGSFHTAMLDEARSQAPQLATAASPAEVRRYYFLGRGGLEFMWKPHPQCVVMQVPVMQGARRILDRRFIINANKKKVEVHAWNINNVRAMRQLISWDVDGIITDYPNKMLSLLRPNPYI